jgi:diguanylate cyclase (GGDEF)-like protein
MDNHRNTGLPAEFTSRGVVFTEHELADRHGSLHDALTGLPNRALFAEQLGNAISQSRRHRSTLAVMLLDLDGFGRVNDAHGRDVGDRILKTIALRLKERTRNDDTASRLGCDEFGYLLTDVGDEKSIATIARKIVKALEAPMHIRLRNIDLELGVKARVGISMHPKDGASVDELLDRAGRALANARRGKSGCAFA